MARPSRRTKDVEDAIIEGICNGQSLPAICDFPRMPSPGTVMTWLAADQARKAPEEKPDAKVLFVDRYRLATRVRLELIAEEVLSISDDGRNDTYTDAEGNTKIDYDNVQRAKLRVDSRKWLLSKLEAKKYGEKPADTNVTTIVHNNHVTVEDQKRLQERHAAALERMKRP